MKKEEFEKILEHNERLIALQEQMSKEIEVLKEKVETLDGLDLAKYLKKETETDEVIDQKIANLLEISNKLRTLNQHKREAIVDYLAKKSGTSKKNLNKVISTFENFLEDLL